MSVANLPSTGTFPVDLSALSGAGGKKGKAKEEVVAFRYAFKPASITAATPAVLTSASGSRRLTYEMQNGSRQVFDVREEASKPRECVLIWNEAEQSFSLRPLPTTLHLTLNRSLSGATRAGPSSVTSSSSSSGSIPLSKRKHASETPSAATPHYGRAEPETEAHRRPKKPRPSAISPPARAPPPAAPTPQKFSRKTLPAAKPAAKSPLAKKAKPMGKYKSAEIIEDSDEEAGDFGDGGGGAGGGAGAAGDGDEMMVDETGTGKGDEGGDEDEEEDDFARMLGDEMAADEAAAGEESDDEGEDEDEEDEDPGLGGARYVSKRPTVPDDLNGDSEWL